MRIFNEFTQRLISVYGQPSEVNPRGPIWNFPMNGQVYRKLQWQVLNAGPSDRNFGLDMRIRKRGSMRKYWQYYRIKVGEDQRMHLVSPIFDLCGTTIHTFEELEEFLTSKRFLEAFCKPNSPAFKREPAAVRFCPGDELPPLLRQRFQRIG